MGTVEARLGLLTGSFWAAKVRLGLEKKRKSGFVSGKKGQEKRNKT